MKNSQVRKQQYNYVCNKLSCMSDASVLSLLSTWKSGHVGIGGVSILGEIDSNPIFVKRIPLTNLETTIKNYRSTANIFNLPMSFQYGIGSLGFGAWRELASHIITSNWVLTDLCANFPIMYHWRVLPDTTNDINLTYWKDDAGYLNYWDNNKAIKRRLTSLRNSSQSIYIFLEYFPKNLSKYLKAVVNANERDLVKGNIIKNIFAQLTKVNDFMQANDFLHMDAHLENILMDDDNVYLSDFGLSISSLFELSEAEKDFMYKHQKYDSYSTDYFLVHGILTSYIGENNWDEKFSLYQNDNSVLPDFINKLIENKVGNVVKMYDFYKNIQQGKSVCLNFIE